MKINRIVISESQRKQLFEAGSESGLTMEAVNAVSNLLETSMNSKMEEIAKALKENARGHYREHFKKLAKESAAKYRKSLARKVDMYLEHVVKDWYAKNSKVVSEGVTGVQNRRIVEGILQVLEGNFVGLKANQRKAFESLTRYAAKVEKIAEHNRKLSDGHRRLAIESQKRAVVEYFARGLTEMQRDKLISMSKSIRAKNLPEFRQAVKSVKRNLVESASNGVSFAPRRAVKSTITESGSIGKSAKTEDQGIQELINQASRLVG